MDFVETLDGLPVFSNSDSFVLLEDSKAVDAHGSSHLFWAPEEIVECASQEDLDDALARVDAGLQQGLHASGWLSYEAGYHMVPRCPPPTNAQTAVPLLWMGLFTEHRRLSPEQVERFWAAQSLADSRYPQIQRLRLNMDREEYLAAIDRIKRYIVEGDTYQVNYTLKYLFDFDGSPYQLYLMLRENQRVEFGAFLQTPSHTVLSLSPELFFQKTGDTIRCKPMKGTAPRGRTLPEDRQRRDHLFQDIKTRSENAMIVDLLRNDLGRIARPGSVKVSRLFEVEKYHTLLQMTSTIEARVDPHLDLADLLKKLFPCGSITGAPKVRTMQIIRELEKAERGVYTGAIGYASPNRDICFNVPIRTVVLRSDGHGEMGIGSGIVHDSVAEQEFDECLLKGRFLSDPHPAFDLIETLLCSRGEYWLLEEHLKRLQASAEYFDYSCPLDDIRQSLFDHSNSLNQLVDWRVRLLLGHHGRFHIESFSMAHDGGQQGAMPLPVMIATGQTHSSNRFLYHKTTNRVEYDAAYQSARNAGFCEVLFTNEHGELTEGSRSNIFVQIDGTLFTPPVECGLLNGVMRQYLLRESATDVAERILSPKDLLRADRLFIANSVRGLTEVQLLPVTDRHDASSSVSMTLSSKEVGHAAYD